MSEATGYLEVRAWTGTLDGGEEPLAELIADTDLLREIEKVVASTIAYHLLLRSSQVSAEGQWFEDKYPCRQGSSGPQAWGSRPCSEPTTRTYRRNMRRCSAGHETSTLPLTTEEEAEQAAADDAAQGWRTA